MQDDLQKLLNFIGEINWFVPGFSGRQCDFPIGHPLKPVYESISIIKWDFDSVLHEKESAEKRILEENKLNQLRADIWRLASDRSSSTIDFIHDLLQVVGEFLGVDRAEYLEYAEKKQRFECRAIKVCQDVRSTLGISFPVSMLEMYTEVTCSQLSDATLSARFATDNNEVLTFKEHFSTQKAYCIPFFVNEGLNGLFLLHYCRLQATTSEKEREVVSRIGQEMTTIAGAYFARKTAEDELQNAYAQLENRVLERTQELVHANKELVVARKAAESASEAKSQFLANMSHEIRTPLNAVIGFSEIIHSTPNADEHKKYAQNILSESHRLLELLNAILDISKIESGKMEVSPHAFGLKRAMNDLAGAYGSQAEQKSLSFDFSFDEILPQAIVADSTKIRQVMVNLLGNAIKFTERGKISFSVKPASSRQSLRFEIADTGIGMSEEARAKLFKPFEQADASITRKYGGTGLGTAISMLLVRLMKGTMGVESQEGYGSTFWVELPFIAAPESFNDEPEPISAGVSLHDKNILLVEDYPPNREIALFFLKGAGAMVDVAENGLEAVSLAQEKTFDLILMDIQMPIMDGLAASREIRGIDKNKSIPILGMTAYAFASDRDKCLAAGMNGVITKPVDWPKALTALCQAICGGVSQKTLENAAARDKIDASVPVDMEAYIKRMNGNKKIAMEILSGFLKLLPDDLTRLAEAIATGNAHDANRIAHSIKGGGKNVCALALGEAAWKLEQSLELGICDDAAVLLEELKKAFGKLRDYMQAYSGSN
jgi:signal transduction histidine kinase/DNA-binding NarL/FixJ family response regulator